MSDDTPDWQYAKQGIELCLNNQADVAIERLEKHSKALQVHMAYAFIIFTNALLSFDDKQIELALHCLRDLESKVTETRWDALKRRFSTSESDDEIIERFEKDIILADTQICTVLLMFLHEDMASYIKGSWILRKAWKLYHNIYNKLYTLYKSTVSESEENECSVNPKFFYSKPTQDNENEENGGEASSTPQNVNALLNKERSDIDIGRQFDSRKISRLMSAVSFGYGLFQVCVSLLPLNLLKIVHFLGFESNREAGIACLMFAQKGEDMRGPMATIALLWYHTILQPFLASEAVYVKPDLEIANKLVTDSARDYPGSAFFLFFKGRIERLNTNSSEAIKIFETALDLSSQWEINIICLNEIAWCHLLRREFERAKKVYILLSQKSHWGRTIYEYAAVITDASDGNFKDIISGKYKIMEQLRNSKHSIYEQSIEKFVTRRLPKFPCDKDDKLKYNAIYWRILTYELLLMWNVLPNCNTEQIRAITEECLSCATGDNVEPTVGLSHLILGTCLSLLEQWEKAIAAYHRCIAKRSEWRNNNSIYEDVHVSVWARYELAKILKEKPESLAEAKSLLIEAKQYKDYDFCNYKSARIQVALSQLDYEINTT